MDNYLMNRIARLYKLMETEKFNRLITSSPQLITYFTNLFPDKVNPYVMIVNPDNGITLVAPEGTSASDITIAEYPAYSVEQYQNPVHNADEKLKELLSGFRGRAAIDTAASPAWLYRAVYGLGQETGEISSQLRELMSVKDDAEVERIKNTLRLNLNSYEKLKKVICPGMSELEVYNHAASAFNETALKPVDFIGDFVSGARSAGVSGSPTERKLVLGDTLIVDILPCLDGYYSDTTRTFFIGMPDDEKRKVYGVLLKALKMGEESIRPGIEAHDVYRRVMKVIEDSGYGSNFPHHAGHGIGTGFYEEPYFIKHCPVLLKEGMVITIEPGIYIEDKFGIRIENNYLITSDGCMNLFDYPLDHDYFTAY